MSMDYSTLLVLDCKYTLWEKPSAQPAGQSTEITRIDIALVDTIRNQITEKEVIYVKPTKSKISAYCEKIFKINQSTIDTEGIPFQEAYRRIRIHYMSRDRLWASWGQSKRYIFDKQCKNLQLEELFTQPHHNIQHMFALMTGSVDEPSLENALKYIELKLTDNHATDIANIYLRMAKGLRPTVIKTRIVVPGQYEQQN